MPPLTRDGGGGTERRPAGAAAAAAAGEAAAATALQGMTVRGRRTGGLSQSRLGLGRCGRDGAPTGNGKGKGEAPPTVTPGGCRANGGVGRRSPRIPPPVLPPPLSAQRSARPIPIPPRRRSPPSRAPRDECTCLSSSEGDLDGGDPLAALSGALWEGVGRWCGRRGEMEGLQSGGGQAEGGRFFDLWALFFRLTLPH